MDTDAAKRRKAAGIIAEDDNKPADDLCAQCAEGEARGLTAARLTNSATTAGSWNPKSRNACRAGATSAARSHASERTAAHARAKAQTISSSPTVPVSARIW